MRAAASETGTVAIVGASVRRATGGRSRSCSPTARAPSGWSAADGDDFNGGAAIYAPDGRALVRADDKGEDVVVADFERAELERIRATHRMLADRPAALPAERNRLVVA